MCVDCIKKRGYCLCSACMKKQYADIFYCTKCKHEKVVKLFLFNHDYDNEP